MKEADSATERAIRASEIVRVLSALSTELVALASEEPAAEEAAQACADAARSTAYLVEGYVGRANSLLDGSDPLAARAIAGCNRSIRTELQKLPQARRAL